MKKNIFEKSLCILLLLMLLSVNSATAVRTIPDPEPALPIPYPVCDPERTIGPDPSPWRIGIIKITPEMREVILNTIEILGPDPSPWLESEYCVVIY